MVDFRWSGYGLRRLVDDLRARNVVEASSQYCAYNNDDGSWMHSDGILYIHLRRLESCYLQEDSAIWLRRCGKVCMRHDTGLRGAGGTLIPSGHAIRQSTYCRHTSASWYLNAVLKRLLCIVPSGFAPDGRGNRD